MKQLTFNFFPELSYQTYEAINRLRITLAYCGVEYKNIMITSSVPKEGKSFIAMNLWRLLAEFGQKVLLIDADMRKSSLYSEYQIALENPTNPPDLVRYLAGQVPMRDAIYSTNVEGGYIVPVLRNMSNPSILLSNPRFSALVTEMSTDYDVVLIDTPPLENVSDALQISHCVNGALLVVKSGETPRKLIRNSIMQLQNAKCTLVGTVLNQVEENKSYYYSNYKKYGYYPSDNERN